MTKWYLRQERRAIKRHGGRPLRKIGSDGILRGRPVEVKSVRKDDRFRIMKSAHRKLVNRGGSYIFCDVSGRSRRMSARSVSKKLGRGKWFKDR